MKNIILNNNVGYKTFTPMNSMDIATFALALYLILRGREWGFVNK